MSTTSSSVSCPSSAAQHQHSATPEGISPPSSHRSQRQRPPKKIKEIVGDGEEVEVDDAEELSKNDIDAIFTKLPHLFDALVNH